MFWFVFWLILGAVVFFVAPPLIPQKLRGGEFGFWKIRGTVATLSARFVGVTLILLGIASTSYVHVPEGHVGHLFRVYGGVPLTGGRIIALDDEKGQQAVTLPPGFHIWTLINVLYNVDTSTAEVNIPHGNVGLLVAKDGKALRAGQAFADPFPANLGYQMLDAKVFLDNGGQRGPQLTVLAPGKYRVNRHLWDVVQKEAAEVEAGFVGVVKSNAWAAVDLGTLRAERPEKCDVIPVKLLSSDDEKGRIDAPLVPVGCTGVWNKPLQPGKYYFNPDAFSVTKIDTRAQVWTYAGGYKRAQISLTVDSKGDIIQTRKEEDIPVDKENNADSAVYVKMEGWDVPLELRVIAQVAPSDASCLVAGVGSLRQVEDRVLTPSIRAITRDVAGGTYEVTEAKADETGKPILDKDGKPVIITVNRPTKVTDLINQRTLIEREIERRIVPEAQKSCVTIREVRLGEPALPPELLVAVRREQLATQLAKAFIQEEAAQRQRIASEKAKATANQQDSLVQAEIEVQRSNQLKTARLNEGTGERDKLTAIADGQRAQQEVLGVDATVKLRQFELILEKVFGFADKHPEVLTAALTNAQKFVPNISVGAGGDGLTGMLSAILGQSLSGNAPLPFAPAERTPATGITGARAQR